MSIVVHAIDSAAVHRAVAKVQVVTKTEVDIVVAKLDRPADLQA